MEPLSCMSKSRRSKILCWTKKLLLAKNIKRMRLLRRSTFACEPITTAAVVYFSLTLLVAAISLPAVPSVPVASPLPKTPSPPCDSPACSRSVPVCSGIAWEGKLLPRFLWRASLSLTKSKMIDRMPWLIRIAWFIGCGLSTRVFRWQKLDNIHKLVIIENISVGLI